MRYQLTEATVAAVRAMLTEALGDDLDDQTIADTLEGETDAFEVIGRLLRRIGEDEAAAEQCRELAAMYTARVKRWQDRVTGSRAAIAHIMESAGIDKLPHPLATIGMRMGKPRRKVVNPDALPAAFRTIVPATWKPDMDAINAADIAPAGVETSNGQPILTIRRK